MSGPLVVFLHRAGWDDRYQAVTLAVTAAAYGEEVTLALFFEPLRLWAAGRFDEGAPPTAAVARVGSLRQTLEEARAELGLRVVACDTAAVLAGVDLGAAGVEPESLPSMWKRARGGRALVV